MIQALIILLGIGILSVIFMRRYMQVEKGVSSSLMSHRRGLMNNLNRFLEKEDFEVTMDELIPEAATIDPKDVGKADSLLKRADAYMQKGDLRNGAKLMIQSLSLDPSNREAYHKLGLLYLRQGKFGKAEMMYRKLIMSAQNDPVFLSNLGLALYQQKKLEEAKGFYQQAIELDDSRAGRFFSLGQILIELGEFEQALDHLRKAVAMDPRNLDYLLTVAQFYIDREMMPEARQLLGEILALAPDSEIAIELMKRAGA